MREGRVGGGGRRKKESKKSPRAVADARARMRELAQSCGLQMSA